MRKIFTTLGCAFAVLAFSMPASAQTVYNVKSVVPAIATAQAWSGDDFWNLNAIQVTFSPNVNKAFISVTGAFATLKTEGDSGSTYNGNLNLQAVTNGLNVSFSDIAGVVDFLKNAETNGATSWVVSIGGFSFTEGELGTSTVEGVSTDAGIITITYPFKNNGGGGETITFQDATFNSTFTAPTDGKYWQLPGLNTASGDPDGYQIKTNSQTNLVEQGINFIYRNQSMEPGAAVQPTAIPTEEGYIYNLANENYNYAGPSLVYTDDSKPIQFTVIAGMYEAQPKVYIEVDKLFTLNADNAEVYFEAPGAEMYYHLESGSSADKLSELSWGVAGSITLDMTAVMMTNGNYAYNIDEQCFNNTYVLKYTGSDDLQMTLKENKYVAGTTPDPEPEPEPEAETIVPETVFTVNDNKPFWVYTPTTAVDNFYFAVDEYYFDVFEADDFFSYLVFSKNSEGTDPIELTPVKTPENKYVYTGKGLEAETPYYLVQINENGDFKVTLYLDEYSTEVIPAIELEYAFTINADNPKYSYSGAEGDYYLFTNSKVDLLENGDFKVLYGSVNVFSAAYGVEAIKTDNGYVYGGLYLQPDEEYIFEYSGSDNITMTLYKGTYSEDGGTTYLDEAEVVEAEFELGNDEAAVVLTWEETLLYAVDETTISIPVYSATGMDVLGTLSLTRIMGTNFIIDAADEVIFSEVGTYTLKLPEGIVQNLAGAINPAQDITVTVTEAEAISTIETAAKAGQVYNLNGVKVANPAKGGIYIIDGKKVMVK